MKQKNNAQSSQRARWTQRGKDRVAVLALVTGTCARLDYGCKKIARRFCLFGAYEQTKSNSRPRKMLAHAAGGIGFDDRIDARGGKRALGDLHLGPAAKSLQ